MTVTGLCGGLRERGRRDADLPGPGAPLVTHSRSFTKREEKGGREGEAEAKKVGREG